MEVKVKDYSSLKELDKIGYVVRLGAHQLTLKHSEQSPALRFSAHKRASSPLGVFLYQSRNLYLDLIANFSYDAQWKF